MPKNLINTETYKKYIYKGLKHWLTHARGLGNEVYS